MKYPKLKLEFNEVAITFGEFEQTIGNEEQLTTDQLKWWNLCKKGNAFSSVHPKNHWFNAYKLDWFSRAASTARIFRVVRYFRTTENKKRFIYLWHT